MTLKYNIKCLFKKNLRQPPLQSARTEVLGRWNRRYVRQQFCTGSYNRQFRSRSCCFCKFMIKSFWFKYSSKDEYPRVYVGADRLWNFSYGFTLSHFKEDKWKWPHYIIWSGNMLLKSNLVVSTYCVQLHHEKPQCKGCFLLRGS